MRDPSASIRPRLASVLTDLQQRDLINRKIVALATDASHEQSRRFFHGEADVSIPQYIALMNDCDVPAAAKLAISQTIHEGTGIDVRHAGSDEPNLTLNADTCRFDCLRRAVDLAQQDAEMWKDSRVTPEELAAHHTLVSQLQTVIDEMRARAARYMVVSRMSA